MKSDSVDGRFVGINVCGGWTMRGIFYGRMSRKIREVGERETEK